MKTNGKLAIVAMLAALVTGAASSQEVVSRRTLTLDGARAVAMAAEREAKRLKAGGAIAVVDEGGHLLVLVRLDGTFAAASEIASAKARSAALFKRPTKLFEDAIGKGRISLVANRELMPLQGGVPVEVGGEVVGAVGVAGAMSADQDTEIALVAASSVKER
jgi:glc operon protein GlcG